MAMISLFPLLSLKIVEEEKKRRQAVELQMIALQAEKNAAMAALTKDRDAQSEAAKKAERKYEVECAALRAEMEALGKNQMKSTSQGLIAFHFLHCSISCVFLSSHLSLMNT